MDKDEQIRRRLWCDVYARVVRTAAEHHHQQQQVDRQIAVNAADMAVEDYLKAWEGI